MPERRCSAKPQDQTSADADSSFSGQIRGSLQYRSCRPGPPRLRFTISQRVLSGILISTDNGFSAGHRFQIGNPKSFSFAHHRKHIAEPVMICEFGVTHTSSKGDRFLDAQAFGKLFEPRPIIPVSNDDAPNVWKSFTNLRQGL